MIYTDFQNKIFPCYSTVAGMVDIDVVIFAKQNAPQPDEDYLVIDMVGSTSFTPTELRYKDIPGIPENPQVQEDAINRSSVEIQLRVFAEEDALGKLSELLTRMCMSSFSDCMFASGIGISYVTEPVDMSYLEDDNYRARADATVTFNITSKYSDTLQTIGTVPVTGDSTHGFVLVDKVISDIPP